MKLNAGSILTVLAILGLSGCATTPAASSIAAVDSAQSFADSTGTIATYTAAGQINHNSAFFQKLGSNQRTCATCHQPDQAMSISAADTLALFNSSNGADPLFTAIDGANCSTATAGDRDAHSVILDKALIRIAIELPASTQFGITVVGDPYGCAITIDPDTDRQIVSVYRRPLPSTSLNFLSDVMWDTRETVDPLSTTSTFQANLATDLTQQLLNAVATHEQGTTAPSSAQISSILSLQQGLFTAQSSDTLAGLLSADGATGGPTNLAAVVFYPGINDAFGQDPDGHAFNRNAMTMFTAWQNSSDTQQASIARGETLFNTARIGIANVGGFVNNPAPGGPGAVNGSCSTCHDTPNVGNHSLPLPLDTGVAHIAYAETNPNIVAALGTLSPETLPIYQITGCTNPAGQPVTYTTTDPGKSLITGLCADVNLVKIPILRGLAARAPYFHDGSANDLTQLVNFYNARFRMNLNPGQKTDLVNFLNSL
jgi:cytochrome c peroxidase